MRQLKSLLCRSRLKGRSLPANTRWFAIMTLPILVAGLYETRTSIIQAHLFSALATRLTYQLSRGPSVSIVFPESGPFNETRGYSQIPKFSHHLVDHQFHIAAQALFSRDLQRLSQWGITPPYREPLSVGLTINDGAGVALYDARSRHQSFSSFDEIPALVVAALLFVENRELGDTTAETRNPVVD